MSIFKSDVDINCFRWLNKSLARIDTKEEGICDFDLNSSEGYFEDDSIGAVVTDGEDFSSFLIIESQGLGFNLHRRVSDM